MDQIVDLYNLEQRHQSSLSSDIIGGKALSLIKLSNAGFPVSPACVLPISFCAGDDPSTRQLADHGQAEVARAIQRLEKFTGQSLGPNAAELRIAVRSGAPVSMPGLMISVLDCSSLEDVYRGVNLVFNSWCSAAAIKYRSRNHLEHLAGTAVLLQKMEDTQCAGVMFTESPSTTTGEGEVQIEAAAGSGMQVAAGEMVDNRWHVDRLTRSIVRDSPRNETELLTPDQVAELADLGLRIEQEFGFPVDVEWGLTAHGWTFFQARRISALRAASARDYLADQNRKLQERRTLGHRYWVRHSLSEQLPFPTPFSWSIIQRLMSGNGGYGQLCRELGYAPSRRVAQHGFLELIGGQIYASAQWLPDMYLTDFPFGYDETALNEHPELINHAPDFLDLDRVGPWFLLKLPYIAWSLRRAANRVGQLRTSVESAFNHVDLPKYTAWLTDQRLSQVDQKNLPQLVENLHNRISVLFDTYFPRLMRPGTTGAALFDQLRRELERIGGPEEGRSAAHQLLGTLQIPFLNTLHEAICDFHAVNQSGADFLDQFGHRAEQGFEFAAPRWKEDPASIPHVSRFTKQTDTPKSDRSDLLNEYLRSHNAGNQFQKLDGLLSDSFNLLAYRELAKDALLKGIELIRDTANSIGRLTGLGNDIYFLRVEEVSTDHSESTTSLIASRRDEWLFWQTFPHPAIVSDHLLTWTSSDPDHSQDTLSGTPISPGIGQGKITAREACDSKGSAGTQFLILCDVLSPEIFVHADRIAGIIVSQAALLSHGAQLARQYGIPVVAIPNASRQLIVGTQAILDGTRGMIRLIRRV